MKLYRLTTSKALNSHFWSRRQIREEGAKQIFEYRNWNFWAWSHFIRRPKKYPSRFLEKLTVDYPAKPKLSRAKIDFYLAIFDVRKALFSTRKNYCSSTAEFLADVHVRACGRRQRRKTYFRKFFRFWRKKYVTILDRISAFSNRFLQKSSSEDLFENLKSGSDI